MLERCPGVHGDQAIDHDPPRVLSVENALYIPLTDRMDVDRRWGIYEADGRLVDAAAYKRGPGRMLVGQSDHIDIPADPQRVAGEMIYGGVVQGHYGHFLLGMLPRYWIDFSAYPDHTILLHSNIRRDVAFTFPFIGEIFAALGLDRSRFCVLDRPSRIDRLLVPEPLFQEMSVAKPAFATLCETIHAGFGPPTPRTEGAVYLSKEKLTTGVWGITDEHRVAARLAEKGVDVVFPEQLPLREQMAIFERYETICGLMGSALHTNLFSRAGNRIVALTHNPFVCSNYALIDKLKANHSTYVYPGAAMKSLGAADGFNCLFECPDPEQVADELFALI